MRTPTDRLSRLDACAHHLRATAQALDAYSVNIQDCGAAIWQATQAGKTRQELIDIAVEYHLRGRAIWRAATGGGGDS